MIAYWRIFLITWTLSFSAVLVRCYVPDAHPSWNLPSNEFPPRLKRDVTLKERVNCDGVIDDLTSQDTRVDSSQRVDSLIEIMKTDGMDAYIIPSSDEHLSEYVSEFDQRRKFISGFSGSAGTAVILADGQRAVWTDGRYFLQAEQQLDCHWILMKDGNDKVPTISEWLSKTLKSTSVVGADPKLVSATDWIKYEKELKENNITFTPFAKNLVDELRPGRDASNISEKPIEILGLQFAGMKWEDKVAKVKKELKERKADMIVITAMDEVAWLFNLRGGDVPYNPVFKSYAIIDKSKVRLFIDKKIGAEVDLHLHVGQCDQECVEIMNYNSIIGTLNAISSLDTVKKVLLPKQYSYSGGASYAIYSAVPEEKREVIISPVLLMKAEKNEVESKGMRNAHKKDAVALIDFLSFLEEEIHAGNSWSEITAATRLEEFRAEQEFYHSLSFNTISAFGSNGAVIHYTPSPETNKKITNQSLYLLDSGGQYKDGTTDVTRTLHYGNPTAFQKEAYTRVLKGALDIAMLIFPKGTKDTRVDVLARRSLYEVGLDYNHGTGHGIGMFLNIHEAPTQMRIYGKEEHELKEGYFFSDEPGYYKDGKFGIRLETILTVVPKKVKYDDFPMLGFEGVTLVPFEPKLIDIPLLEIKQCKFLNSYHDRIRQIIGPELDKQDRLRGKAYMMDRTEPLDCSKAGTESETGSLQMDQSSQKSYARPQHSMIPNVDTSNGNSLHNILTFGSLLVSCSVIFVAR